MQIRILVFLALILVAIPVIGCAEILPTPNVRVTWTPTGDVEGNEFPEGSTVRQTVEYEVDGSDEWFVVDDADSVEYLGAGVGHAATWTLPDFQIYRFRVALRVVYEDVTFIQYCVTDAVQYFGIGGFACDVEPEE